MEIPNFREAKANNIILFCRVYKSDKTLYMHSGIIVCVCRWEEGHTVATTCVTNFSPKHVLTESYT